MVDKWVFAVSLLELTTADLIFLYVLKRQIEQFKIKSTVQPLKWLLLSLVIVLILAHVPLMVVYADTVWNIRQGIDLIYWAVLLNASSVVVGAVLLAVIYRFQTADD